MSNWASGDGFDFRSDRSILEYVTIAEEKRNVPSSPISQTDYRKNFGVQLGRARSNETAVVPDVLPAVPVGINRARARESRKQRSEVPNFEKGVAHNVRQTATKEHVAVAVAPSA